MKTKKHFLLAMVIVTLLAGCQMTTLETFENPVLIYDGEVFGEEDGNGRDLSASWEIASSEKRIQKKVFYGEEAETKKKANATAYAFENKDLSMFLEFDPDKMGDYYLYVDTSYKLPDYRQGATISRIIIESGSNTLEITETNELDLFGRDFIEATADEKPSFVVDEAVEYYPIYFYYQDCKARYYYGLYSITENGTIYFSCNDVDSEKLYKSSQSVNSILKEKGLI